MSRVRPRPASASSAVGATRDTAAVDRPTQPQAEAVVDLDAVAANTARLLEASGGTPVMAVVKADGYGHGMLPAARAALAGGATWLGVATAEEGLALRDGGLRDVPVLAWLLSPGAPLARAVAERVDLSAGDVGGLAAVVAAGASRPGPCRGCTSRPTPASGAGAPGPRRGARSAGRRRRRRPTGRSRWWASGATWPAPTSRTTRRCVPRWPCSARSWRRPAPPGWTRR